MTVSAVAIPVPPNSNLDRSMFVWCGAAGSAGDPLATDAKVQSLLSFCSSNGVNVVFLDIWGRLGGGNWSTANYQAVTKFVHYAHASGIRVMALAGNTDWGQNQQWVMNNIVRHVAQYNALADAASTTTDAAAFDGLMLDVEYWTVPGYTAADPQGLCDLMKAARAVLNVPVGCFTSQWLADPASAALSFSYGGGPTQLEGLNLMDCADFVSVGCYYNNSAQQIATFQKWFDYASQSGRNYGLWCGSETGQGLGAQSYWTGAAGAKAAMETAHAAISAAFTAAPNANASFRGQSVDAYASYLLMA